MHSLKNIPNAVQAISLDLDDTLWPVWPTIERAEQVLHDWLHTHAPRTAAQLGNAQAMRAIRETVVQNHPELQHDFSAMRREAIRLSLLGAGEDPALAVPAFEVFFAERHKVTLYDDALEALQFLSERFPLVAISNGNADVERVGLGAYFSAAISAGKLGVAKPDVRIFEAAAQAVAVPLTQILHVGDDATLDAQGAMAAGMQAVWLNRDGKDWPHDEPPHGVVTDLRQLCGWLGV